MSDLKHYEHAEFLVTKGYVAANTNIEDLATRLQEHERRIERNNTPRKEDVLTREKVYGAEVALEIKEIVDNMDPQAKTLISPADRESAALLNDENDPV